MTGRTFLTVLALCCVSLFIISGCAKSRTDQALPPGATEVEVVEETPQWQPPAQSGPSEAELEEMRRTQAMSDLATMIHFAFDSSELTQEARAILQQKADVLKRYGSINIVIEGYCDERGTQEYNLALGERRARKAYDFLVILGIAPERMRIVSFGEENPLDPASNETAWAMNRRDEFRIVY